MTRYTLTIDTDGAAFDDGHDGTGELSRLLHKHANEVALGIFDFGDGHTILDGNGNTCGRAQMAERPIVDLDGAMSYTSWEGPHGEVGYACTPDGPGPTTYVYLNPSTGSDDGVPTVFLYEGPLGDPGQDAALLHVIPGAPDVPVTVAGE